LLPKNSVRLEIAKLEREWRQLKSQWNSGNCNCYNTSCVYRLAFDVTPGALPIPSRFEEGACCQYWCRINNITDVDVCNCSRIEGMRDDVADDLIDLYRVNKTVTDLLAAASLIVDLTNQTGIIKQLYGIRANWTLLRDDLISKQIQDIATVIEDLQISEILDELCDIIQHCNDDYQTNCSCLFDSTSKIVDCFHIVKDQGKNITARPNRCHDICLAGRLGDTDSTKYSQSSAPSSTTTAVIGDQDPEADDPNSPAKKRALQQNENAVQTSYGVSSSSPSGTSTGSSGTGNVSHASSLIVSLGPLLLASIWLYFR